MRRPGFEPGSTAWKAAILTTVLSTRLKYLPRLRPLEGQAMSTLLFREGCALSRVGEDANFLNASTTNACDFNELII